MRQLFSSLAAITLLALSACSSAPREGRVAQVNNTASSQVALDNPIPASAGKSQEESEPLISSSPPPFNAAKVERKIIRNAELTIESESPEEAFRRVASIAESKGGFVVTSEATQQEGTSESGMMTVSVVVRIPSTQFDTAVGEIRKAASRVLQDKRTGQDVTEEFIDLEARLQAKRALEAQFLTIMRQAQKISDALEVQRQLAEVRAEIEQVEGRRRFLENQSSLSTIKVTIKPPVPIVAATTGGFFSGIREAISDGVDVAAAIVLGLIRIVIALLPILVLIVLPVVLVGRIILRRSKRSQMS